MLHGGATPSDLRIFFSLHRQVARNRSEEIGLGALPVHMLFAKVVNGQMELPTKFKVPLAGYKGMVRGKVILRNIPQWSQLGGDDLVNRDGTISPAHIDLNSRKLLPWIRLPRSLSVRTPTPSPAVRPYSSPAVPALQPSGRSMGSVSETNSDPSSFGHIHPPPSAKWLEQNSSALPGLVPSQSLTGHTGMSSAPVDLDGLSIAAALGQNNSYSTAAPALQQQGHSRESSADYYPEVGPGMYGQEEPRTNFTSTSGAYNGYSQSSVPPGVSMPTSPYFNESFSDKDAQDRESRLQREYQRQQEEYDRQQYYDSLSQVGVASADGEPSATIVDGTGMVGGGRSAKSVASSTTGHDANSQNQSNNGSDDGQTGFSAASSNPGAAAAAGVTPVAASGASAVPLLDDWIAIKDANSERYYFANRVTNESLWLPPLWEVFLDA
jgi:hypothetical protein